jgi:uncharacterized protein DUF955
MSLIGNKNQLAFELVPVQPSWEIHYPPERAAWAGTAIWAGGNNLCRHVLPGSNEVQDFLYLPLGPLADWIVRSFPALSFEERAANFPTSDRLHESVERWADAAPVAGLDQDDWFEARETWWSHHFLQAGADGARLPNLALVRDDEHLVLAWRPPRFAARDDAPEMLSETGKFALDWSEGVQVLDEFTACVAHWLRESGAVDGFPWATDDYPLRTTEPELRDALELLTGRSIETLERLLQVSGYDEMLAALGLSSATADPAESPECQMLRDLSPETPTELGELLLELRQAMNRDSSDSIERWRRLRSIALDATGSASSEIEAGQLAARAVREALDLDGQPIADVAELAMRCGLQHEHTGLSSLHDRMVVGLRENGSLASRTLISARTEQEWARRFETARALGHVLLDRLRSGSIGAASGTFAQGIRQRRSGVFAAELLLPGEAMAAASGGGLDAIAETNVFASLLERYGVGAQTAAYQLWHHGWLSSRVVRDELIEQFTARG